MMQKITVSYHPYDEDLALLTQKDAHNIFSRHKFNRPTGLLLVYYVYHVWKSMGLGSLDELLNLSFVLF